MHKAFLILPLLYPAVASAACGPDAAPPQAAAQGFTCETFRWGPAVGATPADTAAEIDSAQTYAPGYKLYWGTAKNNGHVTVASDYTVNATTGQIRIKTAETNTSDYGGFSLNTCGGPPGQPWTPGVGQYFNNGWYVEFVGEWNATGFTTINPQTGFYGLDMNWADAYSGGSCVYGRCWEVDDPDAMAFDQNIASWSGGTAGNQAVTGKTFSAGQVETGTNRYGILSTASQTTFWHNDTANGTVQYDTATYSAIAAQYFNASKECFGFESQPQFPLYVDSVKIWQKQPPPSSSPAGGTRGLRMGGR
jgi:hypothetical protein